MNNLYERNPVPTGLQELSEGPTGFIYSTYSAAPTQTPSYTSFLQPSDEREASVSYAVGGSVSTVSFEESTTRNRPGTRTRRGGGVRGPGRGFFRVSRRNLLRRLAPTHRSTFWASPV